jgi:hypothetical protein
MCLANERRNGNLIVTNERWNGNLIVTNERWNGNSTITNERRNGNPTRLDLTRLDKLKNRKYNDGESPEQADSHRLTPLPTQTPLQLFHSHQQLTSYDGKAVWDSWYM